MTLERGQGSLVYAVGTLRNSSAHQRFGVKIELDLQDAAGNKIGTATDYIRLIEPRTEWRFRALIFEPQVESAHVSSLQEEE